MYLQNILSYMLKTPSQHCTNKNNSGKQDKARSIKKALSEYTYQIEKRQGSRPDFSQVAGKYCRSAINGLSEYKQI